MHATSQRYANKYKVQHKDQRQFCRDLISDIRNIVYPKLRKKDIGTIEQYFDALRKTLAHTYTTVLAHSDLTYDHILWDKKNKQVGVIDFSDRAVEDPAIDFAGLFDYGTFLLKKCTRIIHAPKMTNC